MAPEVWAARHGDLGLLEPHEAGRLPVVRLNQLLSDEEIAQLLLAAERDVGRRIGSVYRERPHGPWGTWYLHTGGWFKAECREIHDRMVAAVTEVDRKNWGLLARVPDVLGGPVMRSIELHTIHAGGALPSIGHMDNGSMWTLDVMLSEPSIDFTGGAFRTLERDGDMKEHKFGDAGNALVFPSHKRHCVQAVTSGCRQVLVIELARGHAGLCAQVYSALGYV
ncbi:unnamed protein product [Polarella glacialis]|uniref:Prolyl 4-hydroxylase alpha subunit Fe(2+) 2OG dioxygenase domain-containing protein n=1 Tax=Polarella glacialis TaxID=89957 RepID=A0A813GKP4_POLGL|nr:unnamed protein product [Polarella glacialis]